MIRPATTAVLAVLAFLPLAAAADKAAKPAGEWTHAVGDFTINLKFSGETLHVQVAKNTGDTLDVDTAYGVTADGLLFGVVTKVEKAGTDAGPEKGDLFSFQCKVEKDMLTISDVNGNKVSDEAKQLLAGAYTKKK